MKEKMKRKGENKQKMKEGNKIIFGQKTSKDIIAENGRERFMIELKLIVNVFLRYCFIFIIVHCHAYIHQTIEEMAWLPFQKERKGNERKEMKK